MSSRESPIAKLRVRLSLRAASNAVVRYEEGVLHLRLTAPPVEGAANKACCRFVADLLEIAPSRVAVMLGQKSRDKVLAVEGISEDAMQAALAKCSPAA